MPSEGEHPRGRQVSLFYLDPDGIGLGVPTVLGNFKIGRLSFAVKIRFRRNRLIGET
jgi:hypothetical protein